MIFDVLEDGRDSGRLGVGGARLEDRRDDFCRREGVSSAPLPCDVVSDVVTLRLVVPVRLRPERTVTLDGMLWPRAEPLLGDARGGVVIGAGSFDLAECRRSSNFCIFPRRLRNWYTEFD